jgi:exopolysaccharide production protein ExoQ
MTRPVRHDLMSLGDKLRGFEFCVVVPVLMLASTAFPGFLQGPENLNVARTGNWLTNSIWLSSYLLAALALVSRVRLCHEALVRCWPLVGLLAFSALSLVWSEDRLLTFLRLCALCGTTVCGLYLGERLTVLGQARLIASVLVWAAILSLMVGIVVPETGIMTGDLQGDWQGIFGHKNQLGLNMALGFGLSMLLSFTARERRTGHIAGAGLCLVLVFLSRSATGLVCTFVLVLTLLVGWPLLKVWPRFGIKKRLFTLIALGGVIAWTASQYLTLLDLLGRNEDLTGRTQMWSLVAVMISEKPVLGYGYGAFWRGYEGPSGLIWDAMRTEIFYSHNGFLDVCLDLGLAGTGLFVIGYVIGFRRAVAKAVLLRRSTQMWPILFLVFLFISNLTEGSILRANVLPWILYTALYYRLAKATPDIPGLVVDSGRDVRPSSAVAGVVSV